MPNATTHDAARSRITGLTPARQDAIRTRLARDLGPGADLDRIMPVLVEAVAESLPRDGVDIPGLLSRLQGFSDELRRDGRAGMARDLDRLAGVMHGLAGARGPAAPEGLPIPGAARDAKPAFAGAAKRAAPPVEMRVS